MVCLNGAGKFDPAVLFRACGNSCRRSGRTIQSFLFWANLAARLLGRPSNAVRVQAIIATRS